ncbi:retrovirus-related Pol polyprotein from transposon 412 [Trichonephila clavipes]|nr:retrovirus-related Pol polyprotein from transposon 412 [Trichonephila clavipes]
MNLYITNFLRDLATSLHRGPTYNIGKTRAATGVRPSQKRKPRGNRMDYSNKEIVDLLIVYGASNCNAHAAWQLHEKAYSLSHDLRKRDIHPICCKIDGKLQYYCSLRKVNSFESLCDLIISDKLFETLNKKTATHIGIREAEDWFRPIDLAKECDIYISSRSGSHKEIPITYGYTQDPFKNRSQNFKTKIKENYPQYHERENKNCYICGDSSHCARDCEKRFKPKESNDHIHNRINVNTLKVESEKQNSEECANLQYVNIFVENQPVTALIDSGCQIPVLNSSLIRVQTPSEEIITLSSCFGEQRMVEVKPINISLNQQSPSLSVRTAISPTLTEEFIIHPSVYSEIEKLGHAKSDVLLSESGSSLSADLGVQFNSSVSFPNVSVSNVIKTVVMICHMLRTLILK